MFPSFTCIYIAVAVNNDVVLLRCDYVVSGVLVVSFKDFYHFHLLSVYMIHYVLLLLYVLRIITVVLSKVITLLSLVKQIFTEVFPLL